MHSQHESCTRELRGEGWGRAEELKIIEKGVVREENFYEERRLSNKECH